MKPTFLVLLLAGCASPGDRALDMYPDEIAAAMRESGIVCNPIPLRVVLTDDTRPYCQGKDAKGCHRPGPLIVVNTRYPEDEREIVLHELMHWLLRCQGTPDPDHVTAEIWAPGGALERSLR